MSVQGAAGKTSTCLAFKQVMNKCLAPLEGGFVLNAGGGHELLSDLNATQRLCREGKLQDSMTCLEEVYNDCAAESKARNQLDLMLDVGKWRSGMERLCDNIEYLRRHEDCTDLIATESSHCIQQESRNFQEQSGKVITQAVEQGRTGQKDLMELGCRFAGDVIWCFKEPLDREPSCPCKYRQLIVDLVAQSMPPFCKIDADYYYYYSYGDCVAAEGDEEGEGEGEGGEGSAPMQEGYSVADNAKVKTFNYNLPQHQDRKVKDKMGVRILRQPHLGQDPEVNMKHVQDSAGQSQHGGATFTCPVAGVTFTLALLAAYCTPTLH
ncbi:uncharacterized protein [Littorina saxatilis]|uniref:uncharacterized protein n=1 Tax=Littorina saxatilis TaxID=31220 RepID=UPI0038B52C61